MIDIMTLTKSHILMIDDEKDYLDAMKLSLEHEFEVSAYSAIDDALMSLHVSVPDAVILDLHFEDGGDGLKAFQAIKTLLPDLPVFFLSCNSRADVIGQGILAGGVDYFTKSMPPLEIVTRLKARLEKLKKHTIVRCRDFELNTETRQISVNGKKVSFTPKEYDIMKVFMEKQDQLLTKYDLKDILWKDVHVDVNNIDTHMFHIRRKIGEQTEGIECRKGVGYILHSKIS